MPQRRRSRSLCDDGMYICPACGEEIVIPLDVRAGAVQTYTEDCPVCCCPVVIRVFIDADGEVRVQAEAE